MKKAVSILLVLTIISSCFVFVGCSAEEKLGYFKERRIKQDYIEYFNIQDMSADDVVLDYYGGNYNGCEIVMLDAECHDPEKWSESISGSKINYHDPNRLYAWNGGEFMTLSEAYSSEVLSDGDIAQIASKFNSEVTHFRDTGDEFDYGKKDLPIEYDISVFQEINIIYDELGVLLDPKASVDNILPDVSFFGEDIVDSVHLVSLGESYPVERGLYLKLIIKNVEGENFISASILKRVKKKIESIPGVKGVVYRRSSGWANLTNDMADIDLNYKWGIEKTGIDRVWEFTTGINTTIIGIVDSGVALHEDLNDNLIVGYDFYNNNQVTVDDIENHGTLVAGIIGAKKNNSMGTSGVNWNCYMIPFQVDNNRADSELDIDSVIRAINSARESFQTDQPIKLLNLSLSHSFNLDELRTAVENYPGLIVCTAGNEGIDIDQYPSYPSYYGIDSNNPVDNLIVVAAFDQNYQRSIWYNSAGFYLGSSSFGHNTVDIYAPGSDLYSTSIHGGYSNCFGTSFAAPYVTGVAALLMSVKQNITVAEVKECILEGAREIEITTPSGEVQTVKSLDAAGALKYLFDNYLTTYTVGENTISTFVTLNRDSQYTIGKYGIVKINVPFDEEFSVSVSSTGNASDIEIFDDTMEKLEVTKVWDSGNHKMTATVQLEEGTYYIKTVLTNLVTGTQGQIVTVSHEHTAARGEPKDSIWHYNMCSCGYPDGTTSRHVVRTAEIVNNKAPCVVCGYMVSTLNTIIPALPPNALITVPRSANGSYILPNGIIVLVDEDVEAYFAGTLVFYDGENVPVTE